MKTLITALLFLANTFAIAQTNSQGTARVDEENLEALHTGKKNQAPSQQQQIPKKQMQEDQRAGEEPFIDNISGGQNKRKKGAQ